MNSNKLNNSVNAQDKFNQVILDMCQKAFPTNERKRNRIIRKLTTLLDRYYESLQDVEIYSPTQDKKIYNRAKRILKRTNRQLLALIGGLSFQELSPDIRLKSLLDLYEQKNFIPSHVVNDYLREELAKVSNPTIGEGTRSQTQENNYR